MHWSKQSLEYLVQVAGEQTKRVSLPVKRLAKLHQTRNQVAHDTPWRRHESHITESIQIIRTFVFIWLKFVKCDVNSHGLTHSPIVIWLNLVMNDVKNPSTHPHTYSLKLGPDFLVASGPRDNKSANQLRKKSINHQKMHQTNEQTVNKWLILLSTTGLTHPAATLFGWC